VPSLQGPATLGFHGMHRGWRTRARNETNKTAEEFHSRCVRRAPLETRRTLAGDPQIQRLRELLQRGRTVEPKASSSPRWNPSNFKWVTLGGDSARFADQSAILEGPYPVAVPSGAGAKTAHAYFLHKAGHAQRLGAGTMREMLGEGRPNNVCEGVHSEFQHVWSSGLHTCIGFRRRQSSYAKKHVYVVGRRVRP